MLTANSRRQHRVDTEVEMFDATPVPPPIVRCPPRSRGNVIERAWRAVRRAVLAYWYESQIACLKAERKHYSRATHPRIGPDFRRHSDEQLRDLRNRQAWLDIEA